MVDLPSSEMENVLIGDDYHERFDPAVYVKQDYSDFHGEKHPYIKFIVNSLRDIFKSGDIRGQTLLDLGTGPAIHTVISAAPWFDEITLSDFTQKCREALEKWVENDPTAFDYDVIFDYIESLQENAPSESLADMVRAKIKSIVPCDVTQDVILGEPALQPFDAITSSLCIGAATTDEAQFKQVVKNVADMIN